MVTVITVRKKADVKKKESTTFSNGDQTILGNNNEGNKNYRFNNFIN